jgi:hypothetical protein
MTPAGLLPKMVPDTSTGGRAGPSRAIIAPDTWNVD